MITNTAGLVRGKQKKAKKVVIYGVEGIGKSTFAAQFPDPIFIDVEGGTAELEVDRLPTPTSWTLLCEIIDQERKLKRCKTLVIDTIDWAERMCIAELCAKYKKTGIEEFGYGNGWQYEKEKFDKFLDLLQEVVDSGINVVLIAHAKIKKFDQPEEMGAGYDRWELKLGDKTTNKIAPIVKEWADIVLFLNFKTEVIALDKDGKKLKANNNECKRVMYTTRRACWDAKNRFGLPDELPLEYKYIAHLFEDIPTETKAPERVIERAVEQPAPAPVHADVNVVGDLSDFEDVTPLNIPEELPKALKDLMQEYRVSEEDIRLAVSLKGYYPQDMPVSRYDERFISGVLIACWNDVYKMIKENQEDPF